MSTMAGCFASRIEQHLSEHPAGTRNAVSARGARRGESALRRALRGLRTHEQARARREAQGQPKKERTKSSMAPSRPVCRAPAPWLRKAARKKGSGKSRVRALGTLIGEHYDRKGGPESPSGWASRLARPTGVPPPNRAGYAPTRTRQRPPAAPRARPQPLPRAHH